jgi:hypothetical protein
VERCLHRLCSVINKYIIADAVFWIWFSIYNDLFVGGVARFSSMVLHCVLEGKKDQWKQLQNVSDFICCFIHRKPGGLSNVSHPSVDFCSSSYT